MTDNPKGARHLIISDKVPRHKESGQAGTFFVVRSRRKSIGLQINQKAELIIRAPFGVPETWIRKMVREKEPWIEKTRLRILKQLETRKARTFSEGETLEYLGVSYLIAYRPSMKNRVELEDRFWIAEEFKAHAPDLLVRWYKKQALDYLLPFVTQYCAQLGLKMPRIKINAAKTRWGSCSRRGGLNFSYRLMMAPPLVVAYVAAHEAAHLKEQNHGKRFWKVVEYLYPDFKSADQWLKEQGETLCPALQLDQNPTLTER